MELYSARVLAFAFQRVQHHQPSSFPVFPTRVWSLWNGYSFFTPHSPISPDFICFHISIHYKDTDESISAQAVSKGVSSTAQARHVLSTPGNA